MYAEHQKTLLDTELKLNVFIAEDNEFPPHWHEVVEVVYVLDGELEIGVNNQNFLLKTHDIFLINSGDIHYFLPNNHHVQRIILHFEMPILEAFASEVKNKRFNKVLFVENDSIENNPHEVLQKQLFEILKENENKNIGYKIAMKARLYDILVILLRFVSTENYHINNKNSHLKHLERLERVFEYVEENYGNDISLEEISQVAKFSTYHFTRFFKEALQMTFSQYLSSYRIDKAVYYLIKKNISITDVAFLTGFGSVRTFNRAFKQIKGCSPSSFIKAKFD